MKILVPCKRVPDTDHRIKLNADGTALDTANIPFVVNPFDAIALEESIRIQESQSAEVEVIALGIGSDEYEKELRTTLAMGADRAIHVACPDSLDPWNVARVLAALVHREHPDLVLMGKQAVDDDSNQAGQFLAAILGWPQATFASQISFCEPRVAQVARETDAGIERVQVALPAVITADLRLNEPRYASLPSIMKARKKPIDQVTLDDLQVTLDPKVSCVDFEIARSERQCVMAADLTDLVRRLRDEAKVI